MTPIERELQMQNKMYDFKNDPMLSKDGKSLTHVPDEPYEMQRDDQIEDEVEQMMFENHDCTAGPEDGCDCQLLNSKK